MTIKTWDELIQNPSAETDSATLQKTSDFILGMIADGHAWQIDFRHLKNVSVNGEHLALALRCTATRQKWITGWYMALEKSKATLKAEGKDPDDALFGMVANPPVAKLPVPNKYFWQFKCLLGSVVVGSAVFSTDEPDHPPLTVVYSKLLALGKVPSQRYPPMTFHIDPIAWSNAIPHLSEP